VQPADKACAERILRERIMAITPEGLEAKANELILEGGRDFDAIRAELLTAYREQRQAVGTPPSENVSDESKRAAAQADELTPAEQGTVCAILGR